MKKIFIMILSAVCVFATLSFVACGKGNKNETKFETKLSFKTLTVDGTNVYGKVSNNTETFSFVNEIEYSGLIKYFVSFDIYGNQKINTKTISLNVGDNTVYITELLDGEPQTVYEVTIRRRPIYDVTFNTNGGSKVESQQIEEDFCATMPESAERKGYTFVKWNYDFSTPITKDTTISAEWNIITYNIYYNLNGGTIEGENPITYTVEDEITLVNIPTKRGYDFANWDNGGKIEKDSIGDVTFNASYTPIVYKITYDCGKGTNNSLNPLEYTIESETIVFSDAYYINADFVEWRQNGVKVTEIAKGSIGDVTLTAVWDEYDVKLKEDGDNYTVIGLNRGKTDIVIKSAYKGKRVISISDDAFMDCGLIKNVAISNSVTSIGDYAFRGCSGLTNITIGNSVTSIGWSAFSNCSGLTRVNYLGTIDQWAEINFSSSSNPLYYAKKLYINDELVTEVNLTTATKISSYAFENCGGLTSITIPNRVTTIGNSAFEDCSGLTNITIGNSVTAIGDYAFRGCSGLTSVAIPNSVTSIGDGAFGGCNLLKYNVKNNINYLGNEENSYFAAISAVDKSLSSYVIDNSAKIISDSVFKGNENLTSIIIGNSVTYIGSSAFYDCKGLTGITMPDGVTTIGSSAFSGCSGLTNVIIPDSVTSIDYYAFYDCSGLTSVNYLGTIDQWVGINFSGFYSNPLYCAKELYINNELVTEVNLTTATKISAYAFAGCGGLTSIIIPDSVTTIEASAFAYCGRLTSVTIPDSVMSIGDYAFSGCSGLKTVYYKGTAEEWSKISIDDYNGYLTSATRYYYSETKPALNADGTDYDGNYWHYDTDGKTPVIWKKEN